MLASWTTFPSLHQMFVICQALPTMPLMHYHTLSLAPSVDLPTLAKVQQDENITTAVKGTSLVLQSVVIPTTDFTLLCDVATGTPRPYISEKL